MNKDQFESVSNAADTKKLKQLYKMKDLPAEGNRNKEIILGEKKGAVYCKVTFLEGLAGSLRQII